MTIQPLFDRVLIDPIPSEDRTSAGLFIPDNAKDKPTRGKVVAAGSGTDKTPISVKIGDTVLYSKFSGTEVKIEGKDYLFVKESDIFAII